MTKPQHHFYLTFRNVPYTDKEWAHANALRAKFRKNAKYPEEYRELVTRPCHSFRYGPTVYSHKAARKACENALNVLHAQVVSYGIWGPHTAVEHWECRKGSNWKKAK